MKRFSVVELLVLGDFCMVICYGGGGGAEGATEGCFSKESL